MRILVWKILIKVYRYDVSLVEGRYIYNLSCIIFLRYRRNSFCLNGFLGKSLEYFMWVSVSRYNFGGLVFL